MEIEWQIVSGHVLRDNLRENQIIAHFETKNNAVFSECEF